MTSKEPSLKELYAAQSASKGLISRAVENFNKLGKAQRSATVTSSRLSNLRGYWEKFIQQHMQILALADKEATARDEYFVDDLFVETSCIFEEACDFFNEYLAKLKPTPVAQSSLDESQIANTQSDASTIQLPQIAVPTFSGDFQEWENFRDLFLTLVDRNSKLAGVQKLHHLKASLTGQAALTLKNVTVTESNYATAWELLRKRYDNTRAIVYSYLQTLTEIPNISRPSGKELRNRRDKAVDVRQALINLGRPVESWDDLFNYLIVSKFDSASLQDWELTLGSSTALPTFAEIDEFLTRRIRAFDAVESSRQATQIDELKSKRRSSDKRTTFASLQTDSNTIKCAFCKASHALATCNKFKQKHVNERRAFLYENHLCFRCLKPGHSTAKCLSKSNCVACHGKHHTLVHFKNIDSNVSSKRATEAQQKAVAIDLPSTSQQNEEEQSSACNIAYSNMKRALLPSAYVEIIADNGRAIVVRALLDQGSQVTCVTERIADHLKAKKLPVSVNLSGIGGTRAGRVKHAVELEMSPCNLRDREGVKIRFSALVLKNLTSYTPSSFEFNSKWKHLVDLPLADPQPSNFQNFDLLIGASEYGKIMLDGVVKGPPGTPIAQRTVFSWVLSGSCGPKDGNPRSGLQVHHVELLDDLHNELKKFWQLEESPKAQGLTRDQLDCENHFVNTHRRRSDGRYEVRLPFVRNPATTIGDTATIAKKIFRSTELRAKNTPDTYREYQAFLQEYLDLGHMSRIRENESLSDKVFISHLPVLRQESQTTKLRVVFNASMRSSNGKSLNDCLHVGPNLQTNLFAMLIRWRRHRFVYTADIAKMFRQIRVAFEDTKHQCIFWRPSEDSPLAAFRMETVTYGTTCAPFHANRVLKQLAKDEGEKYPLGAAILSNEFYVDDAMFGADDLAVLIQMRDELGRLLMAGGFKLRKWASNSSSLLKDIPSEDHGLAVSRTLQDDERVKVLGIQWNPSSDVFHFQTNNPAPWKTTKRAFLSLLAKIYDPLGWIAPFIVQGKIILQRLWLAKVDWDDNLPVDLKRDCEKFYTMICYTRDISIPRWVGVEGETKSVQLHGFCDASHLAYAAAVYFRVESSSTKVSLLYAKTKVAPLKVQSIPRLELCAAELLSRAINFVLDALRVKPDAVVCWSDSKVVLDWLNAPPGNWKTFVANRVSEVQSSLPSAQWRHVPGTQNPADCASRGCSARDLKAHDLWWHGPRWLSDPPDSWPLQRFTPKDEQVVEELSIQVASGESSTVDPTEIFACFSSWPKLLRVLAYVYKFYNACRKNPKTEKGKVISNAEIQFVKTKCFQLIQTNHFSAELRELVKPNGVMKKSSILALSPYLDKDNIIRVGGRLKHSPLSESKKHPIILPRCYVTSLILRHVHITTLHGGLQLTLRTLRQQYWVVHARTQVKSLIAKCVICVRQRAQTLQQQMGNLPRDRVTPSRPFSVVGVDYAGPFACRASPGRGQKTRKCYLALFVCLCVRAVHLELVSDYTTATFLAAFERFASRRGLPARVFSDNGTNFKGACNELGTRIRDLNSNTDFHNDMATRGVEWKFIPPGAPHFGGLWEAGVKSVKHHLRRLLGAFNPTFEEFSTLLCKIECCLNSRPLCPLRDDPESFDALTPGHFLTGSHLLSVPDVTLLDVSDARLSRWQAIQKLHERFWRLWSSDYLTALQTKTKWRFANDTLRVGDLVLLRNSNLPPTHWNLGRVMEMFKGSDNLARVVRLKTATTKYIRPITQVCRLPVSSEE